MAKIILEFIKNIMFTINVFLRMFLILFFSLTISSTHFPDSIVYERREREENTAVGILSQIRIVDKYDTLPPLSLKWRISMERIYDVTLSSYTTASRDMMLSFDVIYLYLIQQREHIIQRQSVLMIEDVPCLFNNVTRNIFIL